jgi:hypothetical protein
MTPDCPQGNNEDSLRIDYKGGSFCRIGGRA